MRDWRKAGLSPSVLGLFTPSLLRESSLGDSMIFAINAASSYERLPTTLINGTAVDTTAATLTIQ